MMTGRSNKSRGHTPGVLFPWRYKTPPFTPFPFHFYFYDDNVSVTNVLFTVYILWKVKCLVCLQPCLCGSMSVITRSRVPDAETPSVTWRGIMLIADCYTTGVWRRGERLRWEGGRKKGECSMKVTVGRDAANAREGEMKTLRAVRGTMWGERWKRDDESEKRELSTVIQHI